MRLDVEWNTLLSKNVDDLFEILVDAVNKTLASKNAFVQGNIRHRLVQSNTDANREAHVPCLLQLEMYSCFDDTTEDKMGLPMSLLLAAVVDSCPQVSQNHVCYSQRVAK